MARKLVEQAIQAKATRIRESNKRKWEDHQKNNNHNVNTHHQQQNRRHEAAKAYVVAPPEGRGYAGNLSLCNWCRLHHNSLCPPKCGKCQRVGHLEKDCQTKALATNGNSLQNVTSFGYREKGNYKKKCLKGRNLQNKGARGRAYIPLLNGEILKVQGERPEKDPRFLSCMKSGEKKLEYIPIVCNFLDIFLDALLGLPPKREVEFRIDLIPGALPVDKHEVHMKLNLKFLKKEKLYAKFSKCKFWLQEKELNMRHRRWIKLFSDYDRDIHYHPGKENVVADALSRKERLKPRRVHAMSMTIYLGLKTKILDAQGEAFKERKVGTTVCGTIRDCEKSETGSLLSKTASGAEQYS
nr:reverse transcriptase domain-containing protein [Tanacetum cinerariifolium]